MKERSFHDRIHTIGRLTVICALVSFMAVPFVLAMVNHISMNIPQILQNAFPILLTFSISGICENLSFMPIIGSGALYMAWCDRQCEQYEGSGGCQRHGGGRSRAGQ